MKKNLYLLSCLLIMATGNIFAQCYAGFSYNVSGTALPVTVDFISHATDSMGTITSYTWDFGDGSATSTIANPSHIYTSADTFYVCSSITTSSGCTNQFCYTISTVPAIPTIQAYLITDSLNAYSCTAPASVTFYYSAYVTGYSAQDSLLVDITFGDGTDSSFYQQPSQSYISGNAAHGYINSGNYPVQITVTGPDGTTNSATGQTVIVASSCGNISGTLFMDNNGNCIYDAGDTYLPNAAVYLTNANALVRYATTDANGAYSFNVPTGPTYQISAASNFGYNNHYTVTCPANNSISVTTIPSTGNDFGVSCPPGFDLEGYASAWGLRPGFTGSVCVSASNLRCNTPSGQIELVVDPSLTVLPDSGNNYTINGNIVTYQINTAQFNWSFCVLVSVPVTAVIGDSVCFSLNVTPTAGDVDPSNNSMNFCSAIVGSFDPNEKSVNPAGLGTNGAITPATDLSYTIHFQNTGTADAVNIYILDSLSANLDAASVEVIGASHPMTFSILNGNVLRFSFDNIHLIDSQTSETASQGYVSYRVAQSATVAQGATINNTAGIYFDFNQPIFTNTTVNTTDYFLAVNSIEKNNASFTVFPNPAKDYSLLTFADNSERIITITDVVGKNVFSQKTSGHNFSLNTANFTEGIYSVKVIDSKKSISTSKLIITK